MGHLFSVLWKIRTLYKFLIIVKLHWSSSMLLALKRFSIRRSSLSQHLVICVLQGSFTFTIFVKSASKLDIFSIQSVLFKSTTPAVVVHPVLAVGRGLVCLDDAQGYANPGPTMLDRLGSRDLTKRDATLSCLWATGGSQQTGIPATGCSQIRCGVVSSFPPATLRHRVWSSM